LAAPPLQDMAQGSIEKGINTLVNQYNSEQLKQQLHEDKPAGKCILPALIISNEI
jgi:hypothetical protein